jgi:hypothetical protein
VKCWKQMMLCCATKTDPRHQKLNGNWYCLRWKCASITASRL